jgi:low affinity Fe/Cu permease
LDELIRANANAQNRMMLLEDLTEDQIKRLKESFASAATQGSGKQGPD